MNTRKLFSILAVTVAILLICTACGGSPTDSVTVGGISVNGGLGGIGGGGYDDDDDDYDGSDGTTSKLSTPKNVKATAESSSSIIISWKEVSGAYSYCVYRNEKSSGDYDYIGMSSDTSYTDTGLDSKTTYYYKITARTLFGEESAKSSSVSAKTK